jgi:biotin transporter BioY
METSRLEQFRADYRAQIESWYNGVVHVTIIYVIGIAALTYFIRQIESPIRWYQWAVVLFVFLTANIFEWCMHRYVMHRPRKNFIARAIYTRHTLNHHQFFTETNYSTDSVRDYRIVFFPPYTEIAAISLTVPGALLLGYALGANAGWLTMCTPTVLYMTYELFHWSCHVKDNWFVRHCPFINTIRRHHAAHHEQRVMTKLNMNLTFPISDWLFDTSDLDRGLLGTLFNGYSTEHRRKDLDHPRASGGASSKAAVTAR